MQLSRQPFSRRVGEALANPERLAAINRAAVRFYEHRESVMDSLPDAEATRDLARAIRAHTIAHLDRYLEQFETAVQAAGGHVHWARDAAEACRIVLEIAREAGAQRVVKSKSMLSEEIGVNHALEDAGLEVVETDLGEFIAQLAGDHPSHIIAPILHLTRQEVGNVFADRLDVPYTDEIGELNTIARRTLREVFLSADMGISGCNMAVAETGTVCVVTNEGNGRMVTTLPRVHVALMGMERIVPTLDDLAVILQLLGRSATGQKMTVYTSLITGPRRPAEQYGPEETHVVIVDNGRSRALTGDLAEILYCIRCGACLNVCPVYRTIGGHAYGSVYPGPMGAIISPVLGGVPAFAELPHASTLCGACQDVCPVRIDLPTLLLRLRRDTVRQGRSPGWVTAGIKVYAQAARSPGRFRLAARLGGLFSSLTGSGWFAGKLPGPLGAWTRFRAFPPFTRQTFQKRWEDRANG
jgi:L-lactate dehydrogenase complex protein LldF